MIISTRGRYAVRVMCDFAEHAGEGYIPLRDVAKRQDISEKYLEIILRKLVQEDLLKGVRGKGGGYRLTRSPEQYPVGEILELAEGSFAPVSCLEPDAEPCPRAAICPSLPMWKRLDGMIHDFFYSITIADLLAEAPRVQES